MDTKEKNKTIDYFYPNFKKDLFTGQSEQINLYLDDDKFLSLVDKNKNQLFFLMLLNSKNKQIFLTLLDKKIINLNDLLEVDTHTKKNILVSLIINQDYASLKGVLKAYPNLIKYSIFNKSLLEHAYSHYNDDIVELLESEYLNKDEYISLPNCTQKIINYPKSLEFLMLYHMKHQKTLGYENLPDILFKKNHQEALSIINSFVVNNQSILLAPERANTRSLTPYYVHNCISNNHLDLVENLILSMSKNEKEDLFYNYGHKIIKNKDFYQYMLKNISLFNFDNILFTLHIYEHTEAIYLLMKNGVHLHQTKNNYQNYFSNWFEKYYVKQDFQPLFFDKILQEFPLALGNDFLINWTYQYSNINHFFKNENQTQLFLFQKIDLYLDSISNEQKIIFLKEAIHDRISSFDGKHTYLNLEQIEYNYAIIDKLISKYVQFNSNDNNFKTFSKVPHKIAKSGDVRLLQIILKYNSQLEFDDCISKKSFNILKSTHNSELKQFMNILFERQKIESIINTEAVELNNKKKMKL